MIKDVTTVLPASHTKSYTSWSDVRLCKEYWPCAQLCTAWWFGDWFNWFDLTLSDSSDSLPHIGSSQKEAKHRIETRDSLSQHKEVCTCTASTYFISISWNHLSLFSFYDRRLAAVGGRHEFPPKKRKKSYKNLSWFMMVQSSRKGRAVSSLRDML